MKSGLQYSHGIASNHIIKRYASTWLVQTAHNLIIIDSKYKASVAFICHSTTHTSLSHLSSTPLLQMLCYELETQIGKTQQLCTQISTLHGGTELKRGLFCRQIGTKSYDRGNLVIVRAQRNVAKPRQEVSWGKRMILLFNCEEPGRISQVKNGKYILRRRNSPCGGIEE